MPSRVATRAAALADGFEDEEAPARRLLVQALRQVEANDTDHERRYFLVFEALYYALQCGYPAGIRLDPSDPAWPVAYIELPTGQVSWHMPQHEQAWDGHDTPEKYARCRAYYAEQEDRDA